MKRSRGFAMMIWFLASVSAWAQMRMVPHVTGETGGFRTTIILENTTGRSQTFLLRPYDLVGQTLETITGTLANQETRFLSVAGLTGSPMSHFVIDASSNVRVSVAYRVAQGPGTPVQVNETQVSAQRWRLFPGDWDVVFDGLAVVNVGTRETDVEIRQCDLFGSVLQRVTVISALEPMAKGLYVLGAPAGSEFSSRLDTYFEVLTSQPVMLTALRGTPPDAEVNFLWQANAYDLELQAGFVPGEVVWQFQIPGARSALFPLTLEGDLFVAMNLGGEYDQMHRIDAGLGTPLQEYSFLNRIRGVAVHEGRIYLGGGSTANNRLECRDLETDNVIWVMPGTADAIGSWSTAVFLNDRLFISDPYALFCIDSATGDVLWQRQMSLAKLATDGNRLFVGASTPEEIQRLNPNDGSLIWSYETQGAVSEPPAISGDVVYVSSYQARKVFALNAASGARLWEFQTGGYIYSTPTIGEDLVYVGCNDQKVYALDREDGSLAWDFITTGRVRTPTLSNGYLYFNSLGGSVYCVDAATGEPVWDTFVQNLDHEVSPTVSYGFVYVRQQTTGALICLKAETGGQGDWPTQGHDQARSGNTDGP